MPCGSDGIWAGAGGGAESICIRSRLSSTGLAAATLGGSADAFSGVSSVLETPFSSGVIVVALTGRAHVGIAHCTPVKDLSVKPAFCQRLQGAPLRSSARSLSLIAPMLALGPSLERPPARAPGPLGSLEKLLVLEFVQQVSARMNLQFGLLPAWLSGRRSGDSASFGTGFWTGDATTFCCSGCGGCRFRVRSGRRRFGRRARGRVPVGRVYSGNLAINGL